MYRPPSEKEFHTARQKGGNYTFVVKGTTFKGKGKRDAAAVEELLRKIQKTDDKIYSVSFRDWPPPRSWLETGEVDPREYIGDPEPGVILNLEKNSWDGWMVEDWTSMQEVVNLVKSLQRGNKIRQIEREQQRITVITGEWQY